MLLGGIVHRCYVSDYLAVEVRKCAEHSTSKLSRASKGHCPSQSRKDVETPNLRGMG